MKENLKNLIYVILFYTLFLITSKLFSVSLIEDYIFNQYSYLTFILLPLIILYYSSYYSKKRDVEKKYGHKLLKIILPQNYELLLMHFVIYIFASIMLFIYSNNYLLIGYIIHSIFISKAIFDFLLSLNEKSIKRLVDEKTSSIKEKINNYDMKFKNNLSILTAIAIKNSDEKSSDIFYMIQKNLNDILCLMLKNKNHIIESNKKMSKEKYKEEIKYLIQKILYLKENSKLATDSYETSLAKPLKKTYEYESLDGFSLLAKLLIKEYAANKYIENNYIENSSVVRDFGHVFFAILEDDTVDSLWIDKILDIIDDLVFFIQLSEKSQINNKLLILIWDIIKENRVNSEQYGKLCYRFFHLSRLTIKQSNTENHFFYVLASRAFNNTLDLNPENKEHNINFLNEFFKFNEHCLGLKHKHASYEVYDFTRSILIQNKDNSYFDIIKKHIEEIIFKRDWLLFSDRLKISYVILYIEECIDEDKFNKSFSELMHISQKMKSKDVIFIVTKEYCQRFLSESDTDNIKEFFDYYSDYLTTYIYENNNIHFKIAFDNLIDMLNELEVSNSKKLKTEIYNFYTSLIIYCLEKNNSDITQKILADIKNVLRNLTFTNKEIVYILYDIGKSCIEYSNKTVLKTISNKMGWHIEETALRESNTHLFKTAIQKINHLYNLSTTTFKSNDISSFIGTAYIVLGCYIYKHHDNNLIDDTAFQQFNFQINSSISHLNKKHLLENSYFFRLKEYSIDEADNSFDNEHIKKFYKSIEKKIKNSKQ